MRRAMMGVVMVAITLGPAMAQLPGISTVDAVALAACGPRLAEIERQAREAGETVVRRDDTILTTHLPATATRPRMKRDVMCVFTLMGAFVSVGVSETYTVATGR